MKYNLTRKEINSTEVKVRLMLGSWLGEFIFMLGLNLWTIDQAGDEAAEDSSQLR